MNEIRSFRSWIPGTNNEFRYSFISFLDRNEYRSFVIRSWAQERITNGTKFVPFVPFVHFVHFVPGQERNSFISFLFVPIRSFRSFRSTKWTNERISFISFRCQERITNWTKFVIRSWIHERMPWNEIRSIRSWIRSCKERNSFISFLPWTNPGTKFVSFISNSFPAERILGTKFVQFVHFVNELNEFRHRGG